MKKKLIAFIPTFLLMVSMCVICAFAADPKVVDNGDLLSDSEEQALTEKLEALSEKLDMDVVVFTEPSLGDYVSVQNLADDLYDYGDYSADGVYMLVTDGTPGNTDVHIGTAGSAIKKINEKRLNKLIDSTLPELKQQDFAGAFNTFADGAEKAVKASRFASPIFLIVSPIVGIIVGFIYAGALKSQLNSVKMAANANDYIRPGSFNLTGQRDTYLYSDVRRTKIDRSSGSGGTHTGSSGASHGGASRHI